MLSTLLVTLAPGTAYAVTVSSDDGWGNQSITQHNTVDWYGSGDLQSTQGHPVYYQGLTIYDWRDDPKCGRYTNNTTSLDPVDRAGWCDARDLISDSDGGKAKVCRDYNNVPDWCGSWRTLKTW